MMDRKLLKDFGLLFLIEDSSLTFVAFDPGNIIQSKGAPVPA